MGPIDEPEKCTTCAKAPVCLILKTLKGLAAQFEDPTDKAIKAPFEVYDFAKICEQYQPTWATQLPKRTISDVLQSQ